MPPERGVRGRRDPALERTVGASLRTHREELGMSRETLAAGMGITPAKLRDLETATAIVNVGYLARAAQCLGCTVGDFFPAQPEQTAADSPMMHPESQALIKAYYAAPRQHRAAFVDLLQAYGMSRMGR
jgi:transcriptional regulator with XRE-family HTH domain